MHLCDLYFSASYTFEFSPLIFSPSKIGDIHTSLFLVLQADLRKILGPEEHTHSATQMDESESRNPI